MSTIDYEEELNIIKFIARENGYKSEKIGVMNAIYRNRMEYKQSTTLRFDEDVETKYVSIEFNKNFSRHIQKNFQNYGYKIAYKTQNSLEQKIKPKNDSILETGVYKLKCSDCPSFYLGQTGRSFGQRFKEHARDIGKIRTESNFAQHINDTQHNYHDINTNLEVLHRLKKGDLLDRMEEFEIYKNRNNVFMLNSKINTTTNKVYDFILNS